MPTETDLPVHRLCGFARIDGLWQIVHPLIRCCPSCGHAWGFMLQVPETWICGHCYHSVTEGADG